jgi:hypothetical protein
MVVKLLEGLFVSVFNLELFTLGYIVREKEGIRTPFIVNENEIITKRAEVGGSGVNCY